MKEVACTLIENSKGELLFYLRDDKDSIPFPGKWDFFGGHLEPGESPEQALLREIYEELGLRLAKFVLWKKVVCLEGDAWPNTKHVFVTVVDIPEHRLNLYEGQRLKFFSHEEVLKLDFANILGEVVRDYLSERHLIPLDQLV